MRDNGLPRVSEILRDAGLIDSQFFTDYARLRGQALHLATQYLDQGGLLWESVDPLIAGRLNQYQRFLEEVRPQIVAIEFEVRHPTYQYVGHPDRLVVIDGREAILDLKSGAPESWHAVQVALYAACIKRPLARFGLYLTDESYKLHEHTDRDAWEVAKAALTIAAWRRKNGSGS